MSKEALIDSTLCRIKMTVTVCLPISPNTIDIFVPLEPVRMLSVADTGFGCGTSIPTDPVGAAVTRLKCRTVI